jgi:hypothetical protein
MVVLDGELDDLERLRIATSSALAVEDLAEHLADDLVTQ